MIIFFKQITDFISPAANAISMPPAGVAQSLMERAGQDAGRNPQKAAELRDAARAFLSVVR